MRVAWRTVGSILARVWGEVEAACDRLAEVRRIGIDEISHKRGHKYLTAVVDHDSGHLLWAAADDHDCFLHLLRVPLGLSPSRSSNDVAAG